MVSLTDNSYSSVWLKPVFKCLDKIIDCKNSRTIDYSEIKAGNIVNLKFKNETNEVQERTFIATSDWTKEAEAGSFMNLNGRQITVSSRVLKELNVCMIGSI